MVDWNWLPSRLLSDTESHENVANEATIIKKGRAGAACGVRSALLYDPQNLRICLAFLFSITAPRT